MRTIKRRTLLFIKAISVTALLLVMNLIALQPTHKLLNFGTKPRQLFGKKPFQLEMADWAL
jgi:hypothetical protein